MAGFRQGLPIFKHMDDIINLISKEDVSDMLSQIVVITGDTGSGKSTQLPQYVYDSQKITSSILGEGLEDRRLSIVVTQPRRVATTSMAARIKFERGLPENSTEISYAIRFDDRTTADTKMRYLTDGILVRECISVS